MKNIDSHGTAPARHVPQRTCVSCRSIKDKGELIRLVRTSHGNIDIDTDGKKAGRGAYLCHAWECWETGMKHNRLEHALRCSLTDENREQLIGFAKGLLKGADQW